MNNPTGSYLGLAECRKMARLAVAKLAGHGIFDLKHFSRLTNPNLPIWLAVLWIGFDILVAALGTWWDAKKPAGAKTFGLRLGVQTS